MPGRSKEDILGDKRESERRRYKRMKEQAATDHTLAIQAVVKNTSSVDNERLPLNNLHPPTPNREDLPNAGASSRFES